MRVCLLLCVLGGCLRPGAAQAQAQASLSVGVQDSVTHQPLAFASVFLANTTLGTTTTEQGRGWSC